MDLRDRACPANGRELGEIIAAAVSRDRALEICGGGSKREIGRPGRETYAVDTSAFAGIVDYQPNELIMTVRPATLLAEVEVTLAGQGQMLAFEPWDHGALFGGPPHRATIGGIVAAGIAGPRRVSAGSARDHLLGFSAVSGRGEEFKGGGKVVKNVTGYDISKVMAGSWGQLAIMTELTLKVLPMPRATATVTLERLSPEAAIRAMAQALGSPCVPAAAAHVPARGTSPAITAFRLEGFRESIEVRGAQLIKTLGEIAGGTVMEERAASELWSAVREGAILASAETIWRVHIAPSNAAGFAAALDAKNASWFCDWGGALVWVGAPAGLDVRGLAFAFDAHSMLLRAPSEIRKNTAIRHPESAAVAALSARLKRAFDPAGILDPQRFA